MKPADWKYLFQGAISCWSTHKAPRLSASLAFFTLLSLAPLLIVVIWVAGLVFGPDAAEGRLAWQISDLTGGEAAQAIQLVVKNANHAKGGTLATILGLVTLFLGASSVVAELRDALNTIWEVKSAETCSRWRTAIKMLKDRTFAFGIVLGTGFLLLVSLVISTWIAALGAFFGGALSIPEHVLQILNAGVSFLLIACLFAALFKVMPEVPVEWSDVTIGSLGASFMFTFGKWLIGLYLGKSGVASTYGAAGSLVILLIWVYYSAQIFFFGAEITQVYAHKFGSLANLRLSLDQRQAAALIHVPGAGPPV